MYSHHALSFLSIYTFIFLLLLFSSVKRVPAQFLDNNVEWEMKIFVVNENSAKTSGIVFQMFVGVLIISLNKTKDRAAFLGKPHLLAKSSGFKIHGRLIRRVIVTMYKY